VWQGRRGHPVAFGRAWFGALASLSGDRGARALIQANPGKCRELAVADPGILLDIDRPSDLVLY
ncbi:MAG TPA: nucleotidyltransferase family protein, partial [Kineobactrum sp.]